MPVSSAQIRKLFPGAKPALVDAVVSGWGDAEAAGITNRKRVTQFLANIGGETGGLKAIEENLNYSVDGLLKTFGRHRISAADAKRLGRKRGEGALSKARQREIADIIYGGAFGRKQLGNTQPGDGGRYPGRGMMQTTGRANYAAQGFEDNPDALADPATAFLTAVREWKKRGCNALADRGETVAIRKKINGGTNGLDHVRSYLVKAEAIFSDFRPASGPAKAPPVETEPVSPAPTPAAPEPALTKETIMHVQERLRDLGYTEVGDPDGSIGNMTRTAILAFRNENGLPISVEIDDALLTALAKAKQRDIPRNETDEGEIIRKVPEAKTSWLTKIGAFFAGIAALIGSFIDGIIGNLGAAGGYIQPLKDAAGDVPGWAWMLLIAIVAAVLFLIARHGERKSVEAYQTGARR